MFLWNNVALICDVLPMQTYLPNIRVHAYFAPLTPTPSVGGGRRRYCRCCNILWRCILPMQRNKSSDWLESRFVCAKINTNATGWLLHWISLTWYRFCTVCCLLVWTGDVIKFTFKFECCQTLNVFGRFKMYQIFLVDSRWFQIYFYNCWHSNIFA